MKKTLAWLLTLFMVLTVSSVTVFAAETDVAKIGETGYATLTEAFAAAKDGDTITLVGDITVSEGITNTKKIIFDLNGKTITGRDNATGSFALVTNKSELTITGAGTMTLTAANNRGWNAYSSIISNTVGGKLVVESGTLQHLGGTNMAYGIDNLTNGKGTYAETVINGGTIKSTYRAIRQFLNGVEAQNILTVNGGTIESTGGNKGIWMQDPSANANTGTLTIGANATINSDVYLDVTEGSTEWPVTVSIAAAALKNGTTVITENVPSGYTMEFVNGNFGVYDGVVSIGTESYDSLGAALAAAQPGDTVTLLADVTTSSTITIDKAITLDGNGKTITYTGSNRAIEIPNNADAKVNVTIKNLTVDCTASYCQRGINYNDDGKLVLNTVTVKGANVTYALNLPGFSDNCVVEITDSSFTGNIALNIWGENSIITATNSVFVSVDKTEAENYVAISLNNDGAGNAATGAVVTINGGKIIAKDEKGEASTAVRIETDVTVNVSSDTEVVGDTVRESVIVIYEGYSDFYSFDNLQDAIDKAIESNGTVKLVMDTESSESITVTGKVTVDLNGKTFTSTAKKAFELYADATIKNGTIVGANRCVDTRKAVEVTLTNVNMIATATTFGNPQPLTIGGADNGTKVTMNNVNINAGGGYGIITFVKTDLTATGCAISGYNGLYVKPGSENSTFTFVDCDLSGSTAGNDVEGNSFSTIAVRANNVTVNVDKDSTVTANGNYCRAISLGGTYEGEDTVTGSSVTVAGVINGVLLAKSDYVNNDVIISSAYGNVLTAGGLAFANSGDNLIRVTGPAVVAIGGKGYASFADAFAGAQNGDTIVLIDDVNAAVVYDVNKTLTLDLNGYTIESDAAATLTATAGRLTIVDNSAEQSGAIVSVSMKAIHSSAHVAIRSGNVVGAITTANNQADDSQVCITGGNFSVAPDEDLLEHSFIPVVGEDGSITVIANKYEVTLVSSGGVLTGAGFYELGETVYIYVEKNSNYLFAGWLSDDVVITNAGDRLASFEMPAHAVTVTAYWASNGTTTPVTPVYNGVLHFETNGGTAINSITGVYGTKVDLTQFVSTMEGYTFAGWYSDKALTTPVSQITMSITKTVYAGWIKNVTPDVPAVTLPFADVASDAYYYNAVLWAVDTDITNGTSATTFSPDMVCTRAQVVTFLWRAAGCPVASINDMPFADVSRDMYYYDAVLWAVERGITNGISETEFGADMKCNRAQIVTFLWRAQGSPAVAADANFHDVDADAYYAAAVEWAVDNGITNGMGDNTFGADADCTRAQTVTFLYRSFCK